MKEYLDHLKNYKEVADAGKVPAINWQQIRPYLELEHFKPEIIVTKNSAAAGLCSWVVNIVIYYDIVTTVEPKRKALAEANQALEVAQVRLKAVTELVAELQAKLDKLTVEFDAANHDKEEAMAIVSRGHKKLDLAQRLTTALASENVRWAENVETLTQEKELLVGDVLLASAFISYIGPFTKPFRDQLLNEKWLPFLKTCVAGESVSMSDSCNPINILTDPAEMALWNSQGLPADRVSTENASIACNSARWPLMIDPQLQGIRWIRNLEGTEARNLQVCRLGQKDLLKKVERALENGWSILIENLGEKLDAVLTPVVQRATTKKGHTLYVKLGDSEVQFSPKFKLILHTKLSNPHYPPEVQAECTLINFTVTELGLEDQLLSAVVGCERADLAQLNEELIVQQNDFKIKMKQLEDDILRELATAEGDMTENEPLILKLESTKRIASEIGVKSQQAKVTQERISLTSEKYRSVAARGSLLFFMMNDLVKIHTYYIYSLSAFQTVFLRGIDNVTKSKDAKDVLSAEDGDNAEVGSENGDDEGGGGEAKRGVDMSDEAIMERCAMLNASINQTVFNYIRRGLFEGDKLTVVTLMCLRIFMKDGQLSREEVEYLTFSKMSPDPGNMGPLAEWLPEALWPKIKGLESMKVFQGLGDTMQSDSDMWQHWFDNEQPENAALPGDFKHIVPFHALIFLRAVRPDRIPSALRKYINDNMGEKYVNQSPFDMKSTYAETSPLTPVFFVLFPGVDPTTWVESLGEELGISSERGNFTNISMGQGQEGPAEKIVKKYAEEGGWIMLQNVHLMQAWLPSLERQLEVVTENCHQDFRCFISAEPPSFSYQKNMPESLMQSCVKVSNEAPADIKSNLLRAWDNFDQAKIDSCSKPVELKGCLFSLCWFHSIILGRRRFGQQGWSRKYSFNTGDLTICANVLVSYLDDNPVVPWDDLRYIFGEIMYGGHITDPWDRKTNNTYLSVLMNEGILSEMELGPGFKVPKLDDGLDYEGFKVHINDNMPNESPQSFGLHPNAEIGYLTLTSESLFKTILQMSGGGDEGGSGDGGGASSPVVATMNDLLERLPSNFVMVTIKIAAEPLMTSSTAPYVIVCVQECTIMNTLLDMMRKTLVELDKGLKGQLNMSQGMEDLATAFTIDQVPGRNPFSLVSWEKYAWFSNKGLQTWFPDLLLRYKQLDQWVANGLKLPLSIWLPGLFNPTSFLTAVMQVTGRNNNYPLDKMTVITHISTYLNHETIEHYPEDGAYANGLCMQGARWATGDDIADSIYTEGSTGSMPSVHTCSHATPIRKPTP